MSYPRVNYEMTEDELKELLESCKPTSCIMVGAYAPSSPQERANRAWQLFGSGTVGAVAVKHGRDFVGIELNSEYIEIAEKRISNANYQIKLF